MAFLLMALSIIVGLVSLGCFIMVLVQMFQHGETGIGVACIILIFCFGIGGLVAFVYGWIKSAEWGIKNIMMIWSACIGIGLLLNVASFAMNR